MVSRGISMNKDKATKRVKRKLSRALPCPFCGTRPEFKCTVELTPSSHGSTGHYAVREACCKATGTRQTELFFCNDWKKPKFGQWKRTVDRLVDDWNKRQGI
jgi:hypothetical protein